MASKLTADAVSTQHQSEIMMNAQTWGIQDFLQLKEATARP
jgi:hypothetical protein